MAYGELGPTHHSIEDLAWTRAIANLMVIVPADPVETRRLFVRWPPSMGRCSCASAECRSRNVHPADYVFEVDGRPCCARLGRHLVATGVTVAGALEAGTLLEADGISAAVLNLSTIRPIDRDSIVAAAQRGRL